MFLGVSHDPTQGAGPESANFLGPPTCAHLTRETSTKFCRMIKLDERKISTRSTTPLPWPMIFSDIDADVRSVAAGLSNLLVITSVFNISI